MEIHNPEHPANLNQLPIDYESKFYELNKAIIELSEFVNDLISDNNSVALIISKKIEKINIENQKL